MIKFSSVGISLTDHSHTDSTQNTWSHLLSQLVLNLQVRSSLIKSLRYSLHDIILVWLTVKSAIVFLKNSFEGTLKGSKGSSLFNHVLLDERHQSFEDEEELCILWLDNDIRDDGESVVFIKSEFIRFLWFSLPECEHLFLDLLPNIVESILLSPQCRYLSHLLQHLNWLLVRDILGLGVSIAGVYLGTYYSPRRSLHYYGVSVLEVCAVFHHGALYLALVIVICIIVLRQVFELLSLIILVVHMQELELRDCLLLVLESVDGHWWVRNQPELGRCSKQALVIVFHQLESFLKVFILLSISCMGFPHEYFRDPLTQDYLCDV